MNSQTRSTGLHCGEYGGGDTSVTFLGTTPTRAVENHDGVIVGAERPGEVGEEAVHRDGGNGGEDEGEAVIGGGFDGGEKIGPIKALIAQAGRTIPLGPPAETDAPLLPETGLVLEEQADPLARVRRGRRRHRVEKPPFWKRSRALASDLG